MKFSMDKAGVEKSYQDCSQCEPSQRQNKEVPEIFRKCLLQGVTDSHSVSSISSIIRET